MPQNPKHFLDISSVDVSVLNGILTASHAMKASDNVERPLEGKILAMVFDKPSTRTRVSFDVGMRQLGGETLFLSGSDMQLGRGETIADTARVLSRYVDAIMIRTTAHSRLLELAENATVPVINGLTDDTHPCQIMADILTIEEKLGGIKGKKLAWSGDGNNVLNSLIEASALFEFELEIAVPEGREPNQGFIDRARANGAKINVSHNPIEAVSGADCVLTDTWKSMGFEQDTSGHNTFAPFQVNNELLAHAKSTAIFMHCLPAHRGEEVTDEVIDGPQSVVFDEAENRLHVQKGILRWSLSGY